MTETNHKLRAAFLAALMFFAVFAGTVALAGSAGAAHDGGPGLDPGQSQIVEEDRTVNVTDQHVQTLELYVNASNQQENVTIDVSDSMNNGIDVEDASVGLLNGDATVNEGDQEVVVTVNSGQDDVIAVDLTLNSSESDLSDNRVRHVATDDHGHSMNLDYRVIDVGTTVVSQGGSAQTAWQGETVTLWADNVSAIVGIEDLDDRGTTPGQARNFDTSSLSGGDYNTSYEGASGPDLTIRPLNLSVSADSVHADENVVADVSSEDLNGNEVQVRLLDSDGAEQANVTDTLGGDGDVSVDLGQHSEGSYTVEVTHEPSQVQSTTTVEVGEAPESVVNFDESVISQNQGDVAVVSLNATEEFELLVGNQDEMGYEATMTVTPNDDGKAIIAINTYEAGYWADDMNPGDAYEGLEGTSVSGMTADDETGLEDPLDQGLYDLIARNPADTEDEHDIAALNVEDRSTDGISVYTAPQGKWTATSSAASIRTAQDDDVVTEDSEIATSDHIVLEIEASGIYGALEGVAAADRDDYLANESNGVNLVLEQTNPGPNRQANTINLTESDTRVHVDSDNKTVWVALDGRNLDGDLRAPAAGHNYNATFDLDENYAYVDSEDDTESVTDDFTLVERTGELNVDNDDYVTVQADSGQEISGVTSVAPGTELTIRARATGESPFLKAQSATVHDHGDGPVFHAEFDFSNINIGQEFTATVTGGNFDASAPGRVVEADFATVSISNQEVVENGDVVTVDRVYVPDGGFVTIHDDTLLDGAAFDSVRGTSDYLSEGEHNNVEVQLDDSYDLGDHTVIAMPHMDTDGNQEYNFVSSEGAEDGAYEDESGEAVTDQATYSVVEEPTPTPTDEPSDDDGTADDETATATDTPEDEQPGFGAVVALVALLGAALLAARRHAF